MWKALIVFSFVCLVSCSGKIDVGLSDKGASSSGSIGGSNNGGGTSGGIGYQLNMDATEAALAGWSLMTMSNNNQTGSFALTGDGAAHYVVAAPANLLYNIVYPATYSPPISFDPSPGIKAIEFEFHLPEALEVGVGSDIMYSVDGAIGSFSGPGSELCKISLRAKKDGTYQVNISQLGYGELFQSDFNYQNLPLRVGVEIDTHTSTFKIYFDGTEQILLDNNYYSGNYFATLIQGTEFSDNLPGNAGRTASVRLITTAEDMTTNFSSGATDPFGTPIP